MCAAAGQPVRPTTSNLMNVFTIDSGPGTLWKIKVFIHPNAKAIYAEYEHRKITKPLAFCRQLGDAKACETGVSAELHFNRKTLNLKTIVHEATHAAIAFAGRCRLDFNTRQGDEAMAESVEHIVGGVLWWLNKNNVKVGMKT